MAIENAQLTDTQLDLLVVPGGVPNGYAITNVMVCNSSSADAASFDMHLIKSGGSLDNARTIVVKNLELPASETFTFDSEKVVLSPGDKLSFVARPDIGAGVTNLVATVSYLEV